MTYENREAEEDTGAIQTFKVKDDNPDIDVENPDVVNAREMENDYQAAEIIAIETAWMNATNEYAKTQKEQKNYPRIDLMVDKNCLISYTGHMVDFPAEEFQMMVDKVIMARLDLENIINERARDAPHPVYEQSGYQ